MIKKFLNTFYGTVASLKVPDSTVSDNFEEKGKSQAWNKSSDLYLNILKINVKSNKEEVEKRWKKESSDTNNSTLSLNITAYQNSIEAVSNQFNDKNVEDLGKEKFGTTKPIVSASTLLIQNPFEFPRQQNYTVPEPEVSKFKASQRLVTPTKVSVQKNKLIMDMHPQVLRLDPSTELTFVGNNGAFEKAFTEVVTSKLRLDNPSDRIVYFKVKTTAPKHYVVRPNSGIIKPGSSAEISVFLEPVADPLILEREGAKHKFMIQSAFGLNDGTPVDEFWKSITSSAVMDSKLRVVFSVDGSSETTQAPIGHSAAAPAEQPPVTIQTTKDYSTVYDNDLDDDEDTLNREFLETSESFNESGHSVASDVVDIVKGQLEEMKIIKIDVTPKKPILCRGPSTLSNQTVHIEEENTNHIIGSDHEGKNLISFQKL